METAIGRATSDAAALDRGGVDGIVIENFGDAPFYPDDVPKHVVAERESHGLDTPILVGSGVRPDTIGDVLAIADGAIVGTALKEGGETTAPVDEERVAGLVAKADEVR